MLETPPGNRWEGVEPFTYRYIQQVQRGQTRARLAAQGGTCDNL